MKLYKTFSEAAEAVVNDIKASSAVPMHKRITFGCSLKVIGTVPHQIFVNTGVS